MTTVFVGHCVYFSSQICYTIKRVIESESHNMEQKTNLRHLHILQYLYEKTDDEHPATTADITGYLAQKGMTVHRQTIYAR